MDAKTRAERILGYVAQWNIEQIDENQLMGFIAAMIAEAEREAFANGRLDVQYDADTLPEQIEAYKRKAFSEGFAAAKTKAAFSEGFAAAKTKAAFLAHQWADNVYNGNGEMQLVKWIRELAAKIEALEP